MEAQSSSGLRQVESKQDMFDAVANFEKKGDYGTLILDRLGRIISCGTPAERIFASSRVRLMGSLISDFVAGLLLCGSSPSFNTRYLVHLCADGQWRKYEARDAAGRPFGVELSLSRMATAGTDREMFLLSVRCPEQDKRALAQPGETP